MSDARQEAWRNYLGEREQWSAEEEEAWDAGYDAATERLEAELRRALELASEAQDDHDEAKERWAAAEERAVQAEQREAGLVRILTARGCERSGRSVTLAAVGYCINTNHPCETCMALPNHDHGGESCATASCDRAFDVPPNTQDGLQHGFHEHLHRHEGGSMRDHLADIAALRGALRPIRAVRRRMRRLSMRKKAVGVMTAALFVPSQYRPGTQGGERG